jgi:hypothetical protein
METICGPPPARIASARESGKWSELRHCLKKYSDFPATERKKG